MCAWIGITPDENTFEIRAVNEDNAIMPKEGSKGTVLASGPDWSTIQYLPEESMPGGNPNALFGGDIFRDSICLQEGTYDFIMFDSKGVLSLFFECQSEIL